MLLGKHDVSKYLKKMGNKEKTKLGVHGYTQKNFRLQENAQV